MKIAGRNFTYILLLLFSIFIDFSVVAEKVHVSVLNRLGNGNALSLHCRSKDTDLGQQTVAEGGECGWDFTPNVWGTTLFYCDAGWAGFPAFHFDAYSFGRDQFRCRSSCSWLAAAEGVYGFEEETGLWEFMFQWAA